MDAATRERLLASIDTALNHGAHSKIKRVRLLDLWWRVATDGRGDEATLGQSDFEFLTHSLREVARSQPALFMTAMALSPGGVGFLKSVP
jgi:hypothetical protein